MTRCHLCGRAMPEPPIAYPLAWPICKRARCKHVRETHEAQYNKIRHTFNPTYDWFVLEYEPEEGNDD